MTEEEAQEKREKEAQSIRQLFMEQLDVDEEVASILVDEGFTTIEEVAYVPTQEMLQIEEFDEDIVEELRRRAKDALITRAIAKEEALTEAGVEPDLLEMEGMDPQLARALGEKGIKTMEDLAEQSVDDLMDIEGMDEERAAKLIMKAREPWFAEAQQ